MEKFAMIVGAAVMLVVIPIYAAEQVMEKSQPVGEAHVISISAVGAAL